MIFVPEIAAMSCFGKKYLILYCIITGSFRFNLFCLIFIINNKKSLQIKF